MSRDDKDVIGRWNCRWDNRSDFHGGRVAGRTAVVSDGAVGDVAGR